MVRRDGVALHSIAYWADVLSTWIGHPEPMIIRYDPRDLSRIYLRGPDGTYYDLSYRDLRRPPISLWEHRLALKLLHEGGRALVDETAIFRSIETMRTIADDAVLASKTARRQRERRKRIVPAEERSDLLPVEPDEGDNFRPLSKELQPHERMFPVEEWE
jgi:putative transposase